MVFTLMSSIINFHTFILIMLTIESKRKRRPNPKAKLLDQVREVLHFHQYSYRTKQTYCEWIVRFIKFNGKRLPS